ncbi:hypothetical protein KCG44_03850 [Pacificimonas sp. WHA3]|uniref:Uncharacterized protein n=1 Tax=Pacificimonas pallii TaxID=2827236 RepID=A0ABS6SBX3_9SPHN|nr:hypothetical protein [Pacificimonas pallii]MBV7255914.1 hypothetical protein [Pacificimonas pallii]
MRSTSNRTLGIAALIAVLISILTVVPIISDDLRAIEKVGGFFLAAGLLAVPYLILFVSGCTLRKRWSRVAIIVAIATMLVLWLWVWYATFIDTTSSDAQDALAIVVIPAYGAGAALFIGVALKLAEWFQSQHSSDG